MARSKTFTMTHTYVGASISPTSATFTTVPDVSGGALVATPHNIRPGVFTAGTTPEGTSSNPTNDSNS